MFFVVFTILLGLLPISLHEIGHAWAMRRCGVSIEEISLLGFKLPFLPSMTWEHRFRDEKKPTKISVHPFLIGAYVLPEEGAIDRLSVKDKAFVFGAGPWANFLWTALVFGGLGVTSSHSVFAPVGTLLLVIAAGIALTPRFFSRYVVLAVGLGLLSLLVYSTYLDVHSVAAGMGGPVTITKDMSGIYAQGVVVKHQFRQAFFISGIVSILLGTTNALPLMPLDAGHIVRAYLGLLNKKLAKGVAIAGAFCFVLLVGSALFNDVSGLL